MVANDVDGQQAKYADHGAASIAVRATLEKQQSPIELAPTKKRKY